MPAWSISPSVLTRHSGAPSDGGGQIHRRSRPDFSILAYAFAPNAKSLLTATPSMLLSMFAAFVDNDEPHTTVMAMLIAAGRGSSQDQAEVNDGRGDELYYQSLTGVTWKAMKRLDNRLRWADACCSRCRSSCC